MLTNLKAYSVHMGPADCAVSLSDGSERGSYVNQDYILGKLGRPHQAINLMYCYYPYDKGWPKRASAAYSDLSVSYVWDYPYDDYFTYKGGLNGTHDDEPFTFMRDIRRHGQDVLLTLTCDPNVTDDHLIAIAKDLTTFGRVRLRINHEATGDWFSFNKRCTYQEVADFYVRFHNTIKRYSPNVETILCIDGIKKIDQVEMKKEIEFTEAVRVTDIWSVDKYLALHWSWPYDVADRGITTQERYTPAHIYELAKRSYKRFMFLNDGVSKKMVMSELNADGDVTGPYEQVKMIREFCEMIKNDPDKWLSGFTFYQFRDDGRLGLEITDPNNRDVGIEMPILNEYKKIIHEDFFKPSMVCGEEIFFPAKLRWGGSEDSDGLAVFLKFKDNPVFAEIYFDKELIDLNLMIEINEYWFYKAPGTKCIDMMPAFFQKPLDREEELIMRIFAPPASGENDPTQGDDWQQNYYTVITKLPDIRLRYEAILK